ncbi:MAG: DUF2232 domain-containing protein [Turicibacter sp.]
MNTKSLVNAAMMMAIYLVFFILYNVGILSGFITFLLPVPFIIYHHVNPKITDLIWLFIGCLLGSYLIGSIFGLITTVTYGLSGIILAIGMKKEWPYWQRIINSAIVFLIALPLTTQLIAGMSMSQMMIDMVNESMALMNELPFLSEDLMTKATNIFEPMLTFIPLLMPTFLLIIGGVNSIIIDKVGCMLVNRMKLAEIRSQIFADFQLGSMLAIILIVSNFASIFIKNQGLSVILLNIMILLNLLFMVQGFIVISGFFKQRKQKGLGMAVIVFALFSNLSLFVSMIGMMDALFDYRSRFNLTES